MVMKTEEHTLLERVKQAGFEHWTETIHLFVGGSALHGAKVEGYDDLDIYGVYVEPPDRILGIDPTEHFVWSSSTEKEKNTKDDVDITLYGLQKWARLACKGNPSILHALFAKNELKQPVAQDTWFHAVQAYSHAFLCKNHAKQFLGFANAQLMRMKGERSKNVSRPDLVEKYGYDTKFAMHVIRLLVECEELMMAHRITLPSPEKELLIAIRTGQQTQAWVLEEADRRFKSCQTAMEKTTLRDQVDREFIGKRIAEAYRQHWQKWRL